MRKFKFTLLGLILAVAIPMFAIGATIYIDLVRGDANHAGRIKLSDGSSNWITLDTVAQSADWTWKWPSGAGTNGQVLKTNGSGVTSWTSVTGFGVTTFADTTIPYASATDTFEFDAANFAFDNTTNGNFLKLGGGTAAGQLRLLEGSGGGTNYVAIKAPATVTSNYTLTLPDGIADKGLLYASAAGTLSVDATNFSYDDSTNANRLTLGAGTAGGQIGLLEGSGGGTSVATITAPAALAGDVNLIIPATAVATGGILYGSAANTTAWLATTARPGMALTNDGASNIPAYSPRETLLFAGIADAPSHAGTTGAETALTLATDEGTPTIAVANLLPGAVLDWDAALTIASDADGDETLTINVYLGSQLVGTSGAIAADGASTWFCQGHIKLRTGTNAGTGFYNAMFANGVVIPTTSAAAFAAFDCTATQELIIKADWGGTTDANDTVVLNDANLHLNNVD